MKHGARYWRLRMLALYPGARISTTAQMSGSVRCRVIWPGGVVYASSYREAWKRAYELATKYLWEHAVGSL